MKLDNILVLMLEYDRIDLSESIDTNKNILTSKECYLCGYWYFINKNFIIKNICVMVVMICL